MEDLTTWLVLGGVVAFFSFAGWLSNTLEEREQAKTRSNELSLKNQKLQDLVNQWEEYSNTLDDKEKQYNEFVVNKERQLTVREELFNRLFKERTQNYPVVGQIWADLTSHTEEERERALRFKKRPAIVAAEEVKAIKHEKRELIKELVYWKYKSQNYEAIYPWLTEELEQDIANEVQAEVYYTVYTEKEREDPVSQYVSPEDYRKLDPGDRNQLALDRYWQRGKKTKWMIGKMYERYVGYLYEKDGWDVDYFGIHKRFEDLGRDIIARKGKNIHVVQCKNWSKFKTIYENHVFQLFGTTYGFQKEHPGKTVTPVFYCSTVLSDTAGEFAQRLGIIVHSEHAFQTYPAIKCNISPNGDRIYHLPFDQQYDNVKITPRTGEFYANTIKEAEEHGFRRAFRWKGIKA